MIKPTTIICAVEQFSIGLCFSVVYGALFIKTNRISRIFAASKKTSKRPMFISPKSQLIMCSGIVAVQVLINVIWFLVSPPKAINHYPTREDNLLACQVRFMFNIMLELMLQNAEYHPSDNSNLEDIKVCSLLRNKNRCYLFRIIYFK